MSSLTFQCPFCHTLFNSLQSVSNHQIATKCMQPLISELRDSNNEETIPVYEPTYRSRIEVNQNEDTQEEEIMDGDVIMEDPPVTEGKN